MKIHLNLKRAARSMSERRAFRRLHASTLPGLTATTLFSTQPLSLIDVSNGGALIETDNRLQPGERESLMLSGAQIIKVPAKVLRVEIVRLQPRVAYRSAVQFLRPICVDALGGSTAELEVEATTSQKTVGDHIELDAIVPAFVDIAPGISERNRGIISELHERFQSELRRLGRVDGIRICSPTSVGGAQDSIYLDIPTAAPDDRRVLQVFFPSGVVPTADEFQALKALARLAAELLPIDEEVQSDQLIAR